MKSSNEFEEDSRRNLIRKFHSRNERIFPGWRHFKSNFVHVILQAILFPDIPISMAETGMNTIMWAISFCRIVVERYLISRK